MNGTMQKVTKDMIPDYAPATVQLPNGWTAEVRTEWDDEFEAPWEREDGHGPVEEVWQNVDFERMRRYCLGPDGDGWGYMGVMVTVKDAEGEEVESTSLWGVESDGDYWQEVAAELINDVCAGLVLPCVG